MFSMWLKMCHSSIEYIIHFITSLPKISVRYYPVMRHDIVDKANKDTEHSKDYSDHYTKGILDPKRFYAFKNKEYW